MYLKTIFRVKLFLFGIIFFVSLNKYLQAQQITFSNSYSWYNTGENQAWRFLELPDSSFYLAGLTGSVVGSGSNNESYLMRLDKFGDSIWTKHYGINTLLPGLNFFDDTSFIVSGALFYSNTSLPTIGVAKLNLLGDTIWVKRFGHPYFTCPSYAAIINKDLYGGFIVGSSYACDYGFLKLDSAGNEVWHQYNNMSFGCYEIKSDPLGGYVSCGSDGSSLTPYVVTRLDSAGNILWLRNYGVNLSQAEYRIATNVVFTSDSNYLVSCYGNDWQLMKINRDNGDTMWTRNYADTANNIQFHLNTIVTAGIDTFICVANGTYMLIDNNGDSIWKKKLPFSPYNEVYNVKKTLDGGFAFSGSFFRFNPMRRIACFFKTNPSGEIISTGIFNLDEGNAFQFFPNPATNELYINPGSMANEKNLQFKLYEMQGRIVLQKLFNSNQTIDVTTVPEGLYIGVLKGKEKEVRGKVIVQR